MNEELDTFDRYMMAFVTVMLFLIFGGLVVALVVQAVTHPLEVVYFFAGISFVGLAVFIVAQFLKDKEL